MSEDDETARRRRAVQAGETDTVRWSNRKSLSPQWALRAGRAAQMVPAYGTVLDIGCGAMDLEKVLPQGCSYQPSDFVARDERTIVCDLNKGEFPSHVPADVVTMLGVLEYIREPLELLKKVRALNCPLVCSYAITDRRPDLDRASQGWINSFDFASLQSLMRQAGFALQGREPLDAFQDLFRFVPATEYFAPVSTKRVAVLTYYNDPNFGDRLGFHVINSLLPAHAVVTHGAHEPWSLPEGPFDLLILGAGNSLNAKSMEDPKLLRLVETTPTLGLFGTQYRNQYRFDGRDKNLEAVLSNLVTWWARYEEDIRVFGRRRGNVRHLGDILISAFPMSTPTLDRTLHIEATTRYNELPLDRMIQKIQAYRRVKSARLHPMLCALTSAEQVAYVDARESSTRRLSEKFRSMFFDVFGRAFEEEKFHDVDRDAVVRYKRLVSANMTQLQSQIAQLLA